MIISLKPPAVPSFKSTILTFHPLFSANFEYILNKSPAKILASSPPVPALSSITIFLESSGSFGISIIFNSSSISLIKSLFEDNSEDANSIISLSLSDFKISSASLIFSLIVLYSFILSTISFKSLYSFEILTYCF